MNVIPMNESQDSSEDEERVITKLRKGAKRIQEGAEDAVINFRGFWRKHFLPREDDHQDEATDDTDGTNMSEAELKIRDTLKDIDDASLDKIEEAFTANNLCRCKNPVTTAFEVSSKLRELSYYRDDNAVFFTTLAEQVEDFSVTLMDQINTKEEISIGHEESSDMDPYASLLDSITESAIRFSQKKFVSLPLSYRLLIQRWNYGLPLDCQPGKKLRFLVYVFIVLDTILTPVFLPLITYAFYKDQVTCLTREVVKRNKKTLRDMYLDYLTTPFVIFLKEKLQQVVFIALHIRICVLGSPVSPRIEEYLILVFYIGLLISEFQQYYTSQSKVYFRNMWNYVDVITLSCHAIIFVLRVASIVKGGDPYHNRLLAVINYLYGVNTLLLVLRFSSILELNKTVGPLQLALFRMIVDLMIILVQFVFVILAFSVAITMIYTAEMSYLTPAQEVETNRTQVKSFCASGSSSCLFKASTHLVWSVFGLTNLETLESHDTWSDTVVGILYVMFLVLTVIMLINMLVALLNNTYSKVETNADVEWKFARAVVADEYRRHHPIVVPFNIITFPISHCYIKKYGDSRAERARRRRRRLYEKFYYKVLFPTITKRYLEKHGASFPISIEAKVDQLQRNVQKILQFLKLDAKLEGEVQHQVQTSAQNSRNLQEAGISYHTTV